MRLIDVHCHINDSDYGDVTALLNRARACGVEKIIAVGFDVGSSEYCRALSARFNGVYFCAGFHPTELSKYREGDLDKIRALAEDGKCVAIGEIGLDYHYPDTDKELQREIFARQILLADELELPVQIHSRDSAQDTLNILKEYEGKLTHGFMLHCFSYSPEVAKEVENAGGYFSFGGTCTYSGSKKAKRTIAALPADRVMTETDSPYLPPVSKRGIFPNTPESIPEILSVIADIRGETAESAADEVWEAAHTLFKKLKPA